MTMRGGAAVTGIVGFVLGTVLSPVLLQSQTPSKMAGTLAHVAFAVRDVDKTGAAFAEVFGVTVAPGRTVRNVPFPPSYGGATMNVKFTQFTANGLTFELLQPLDGPSPWKDFLEKHGEGVHHIGFNVADYLEARTMLESKGGKWTQAASPTAAYVDMEPFLPITFEVFGPRPAAAAAPAPGANR
jgi:catechol 2,3-dioxygenase-like lactoylglutathione lyase family enzyme